MNSQFTGPLFIVGMPRSGTKLLRTLLNNHSSIYIPSNETNLIPYLCKQVNEIGNINNEKNFHTFYKKISTQTYFKNRRFDGKINIMEKEWFMACKNFTPQELFKTLVHHNLKFSNSSPVIWGDKSPSYINHASLIKALYPQAKFIHIIRDVRDYCLSINKAWGKNMLRAAHRWNEDILNFRKSVSPYSSDVIEIKYEDLIDNPENTLHKLCSFLSIPYEENMHILRKAPENLGEAKNMEFIKKDNKNKYNKLNPTVLKKIEGIAYECLKNSGYPIPKSIQNLTLPNYQLHIYKLYDAINLLLFYTRERGLSYLFKN